MGQLHELLAVEGDVAAQLNKIVQETLHNFSSENQVTGLKKTYKPSLEGEEELPGEEKIMPTTVPDRMAYTLGFFKARIDATVSKEATNQSQAAIADVVLPNGKVVYKALPATALLFLEHAIKKLRDIVNVVPTLDAAVRWTPEPTMKHVYRSPEDVKTRTKKVEEFQVIVPATKEHPAQVAKTTQDKKVGEWHQVNFSGAVSSAKKAEWMKNCEDLLGAIKQARQRANSANIVKVEVANSLFDAIFGSDLK